MLSWFESKSRSTSRVLRLWSAVFGSRRVLMSKNIAFKKLVEDLLVAYKRFCLNRLAHEKVEGAYYSTFREIWDNLLVSLETESIMVLARFFDPQNPKHKPRLAFSFFFDLKTEFRNHLTVIGSVKKCRDNLVAHRDLNSASDMQRFLKKHGLKPNDIWSLFEKIIEVLESKNGQFSLTDDLKAKFENGRLLVKQQFQDFIPAKYQ